jgi:hypothetical protein
VKPAEHARDLDRLGRVDVHDLACRCTAGDKPIMGQPEDLAFFAERPPARGGAAG